MRDPKFMYVPEVARIVKRAPYTVREAIAEGRLPAIRDGYRILADVEAAKRLYADRPVVRAERQRLAARGRWVA